MGVIPLPLSTGGHRYGGFRSVPDARDFGMARLAAPAQLPHISDLSAYAGPIKNQKQLGACTAFSSTSMHQLLHRKYKGDSPVFSPLFQYYNERSMDGDL